MATRRGYGEEVAILGDGSETIGEDLYLESEETEVIDCIYQGDKVGFGNRECCGGKQRQESVYRCLCQDESADYCMATDDRPSMVAIQLGDEEPRFEHVAFCGRCTHRVRPQ